MYCRGKCIMTRKKLKQHHLPSHPGIATKAKCSNTVPSAQASYNQSSIDANSLLRLIVLKSPTPS